MTFTPGEVLLIAVVAVLVVTAFEVGWWLGRRELERERTAILRRRLEGRP